MRKSSSLRREPLLPSYFTYRPFSYSARARSRAFGCTFRTQFAHKFAHSSHTVRTLFAQLLQRCEHALSLALLPPLLELDGELGLDVGEAVHDALELVEGEAASACHVLGFGFGFGSGSG